MRKLILTEIVARTAKNILRGQMRKVKSAEESAYRKIVIDFFNLLFSNKRKSATYCNFYLTQSVFKRFPRDMLQNISPYSPELHANTRSNDDSDNNPANNALRGNNPPNADYLTSPPSAAAMQPSMSENPTTSSKQALVQPLIMLLSRDVQEQGKLMDNAISSAIK